MRKPIYFLLAVSLVLGLCGCQPQAGFVRPEASPTAVPAPEPIQIPKADVPPGEYVPWQEAYMGYLSALCGREAIAYTRYENASELERALNPRLWSALCISSDHYCLYDVDKDGIPELFIAFGHISNPDYRVYTYRDGRVTFIGAIRETCAHFHSWPGENALLVSWGRMFYWGYSKYTIENGALVCKGILHDEELIGGKIVGHKDAEEVVSGTVRIPEYYTHTVHEQGDAPPLLLPICDFEPSARKALQIVEDTEVHTAIGKVLWENAKFFGVSGEGFYGDTGWVTLEEYLQPGVAYPYNREALSASAFAWADVNRDGQSECILRLEKPEELRDGPYYAVFTLQEGQVYAYFFGFINDAAAYFQNYRISFYQNQCHDIPSSPSASGIALNWEPFTMAE